MDKSILSKLIVLLLTITIMSSAFSSCNSKDKNTLGKIFSGKAKGYSGDVTVKLGIRNDGYMDSIHIKCPKEDPEIITKLIPAMSRQILEEQSLFVDTITGSTITYNAVIEATKKALEKGGFDVTKYVQK